MALYALGDLHLSFSVDKPMDIFDPVWKDHEKKIEKYWRKKITPEDTIVLTGDHSWGRNVKECEADFAFIESLPGRKILLRGNHDMFWDAKKTERLNQEFAGRFFSFSRIILPSMRAMLWWARRATVTREKDSIEHFLKIRKRETERLRVSFEAAKAAGCEKFLMFLHYPPTTIGGDGKSLHEDGRGVWSRAGDLFPLSWKERFDDSFKGEVNGVYYRLVSGII